MQDAAVVFTTHYPDIKSKEMCFMSPELPYLAQYFQRVIIVPFRPQQCKELFVEGLQIDTSLSSIFFPKRNLTLMKSFIGSLGMTCCIKELLSNIPSFTNRVMLSKFLAAATISSVMGDWLKRFIKTHSIDIDHSVFYTYWANEITFGLGLAKEECGIRIVSRAHGGDVLHEHHIDKYIPFHGVILKFIDRVYCCSDYIRQYLLQFYPVLESRMEVSYLGTIDPGSLSGASLDGEFRLVSCAFVDEAWRKRIHLVVEALSELCRHNAGTRITWTHFGGGPLLSHIKDLAAQLLPDTVTCCFKGNVPNDQIISYYRDNPVDLFINTSYSEGLPVSIMEALSCGIPVMAPAINGIPEAIDDDNGFLFPRDASARHIAEVLDNIIRMRDYLLKKRSNARRKWQERFRANVNYDEFARNLSTLSI